MQLLFRKKYWKVLLNQLQVELILLLRVLATSRNQRVATQIYNKHDGSYRVEYTPYDVGK